MSEQTSPYQNVTFPSGEGTAHGYLALPASGTGPGLVVIQEWWGLTSHVKSVADRFAAEGFVALAPDLFGGATTHDADEAGELMQSLPVTEAAADLSGAVDYLLAHDAVTSASVGAVGFCMGGGFVLVMAALESQRVGAAVPFYGVGGYDRVDLAGITAPVLAHIGTEDQMISADVVAQLRSDLESRTSSTVDIRMYEGAGHAFFNDDNHMGTYDPAYADTAWQATLDFLRTHLSQPS